MGDLCPAFRWTERGQSVLLTLAVSEVTLIRKNMSLQDILGWSALGPDIALNKDHLRAGIFFNVHFADKKLNLK